MTKPTDIARLRELLEKATPWRVVDQIFIEAKAPTEFYYKRKEMDHWEWRELNNGYDFCRGAAKFDSFTAELIVESRNTLPAILDELEYLRKECKEMQDGVLRGISDVQKRKEESRKLREFKKEAMELIVRCENWAEAIESQVEIRQWCGEFLEKWSKADE